MRNTGKKSKYIKSDKYKWRLRASLTMLILFFGQLLFLPFVLLDKCNPSEIISILIVEIFLLFLVILRFYNTFKLLKRKNFGASAWYNLAMIYFDLKQYDKALSACEQSLKIDPKSKNALKLKDIIINTRNSI